MGRTIFFASCGLVWGVGGGVEAVAGCDTRGSWGFGFGVWCSGREEGAEDILKGGWEGRLEERLVGVMID